MSLGGEKNVQRQRRLYSETISEAVFRVENLISGSGKVITNDGVRTCVERM